MKQLIKKIIGKKGLLFYRHYIKGEWREIEVIQQFMEKYAPKPNSVMVDVGLHYGESSEPFLNSGWKVIGFEPDQKNLSILRKNLGPQPGLTIHEFAVADKPGELPFYDSTESSGISSLLNFHDTHVPTSVVKVETLTHVLEQDQIKEFRFLKIDAEGYDLLVMKGLDFEKFASIEFVLCEFEDHKTSLLNYNVQDMADFLVSKGFHVLVCEFEPIVKYGRKHKFIESKTYPCSISPDGWGNLIAHKDKRFAQYAMKRMNKK